MFQYMESLTTRRSASEHVGWLGAALGDVHALAAAGSRVAAKGVAELHLGCKRVLFSSAYCPRCAGERSPDHRAYPRMTPEGLETADGSGTWWTASSTAPASRPPTSCSRWRSPARMGARCARCGPGERTLTWASRAWVPVDVHSVRAEHELLGGSIIFYSRRRPATCAKALQRVREAGAAAIEVRAEVEEASDRRCSRVRRHRVDRVATRGTRTGRANRGHWPRIHGRVRPADRTLDPAQYRLIPRSQSTPAGSRNRRRPLSPAPFNQPDGVGSQYFTREPGTS